VHALTGWLTGLRVTRDDHVVGESLHHDLVFVAFLKGVANGIGSKCAGSDQALFFASDGHVRGGCHGMLSLLKRHKRQAPLPVRANLDISTFMPVITLPLFINNLCKQLQQK
jgi:hypothetical protein